MALGFGCAAVLVASFGSAQMAAVYAGLPESIEVQAVVSLQASGLDPDSLVHLAYSGGIDRISHYSEMVRVYPNKVYRQC